MERLREKEREAFEIAMEETQQIKSEFKKTRNKLDELLTELSEKKIHD